jgi:transposase-like protein
MIKPRQALFKWRHFEPEIIICAVRWYLRFSLSYRDVEELLLVWSDNWILASRG